MEPADSFDIKLQEIVLKNRLRNIYIVDNLEFYLSIGGFEKAQEVIQTHINRDEANLILNDSGKLFENNISRVEGEEKESLQALIQGFTEAAREYMDTPFAS